jgi:hypothetical protein
MRPTYLVVLLQGGGADAASFRPLAQVLAPGLPQVQILVPDGLHPFDGGGLSGSGSMPKTRQRRPLSRHGLR